jgi:sulfur carrier protein
MRLFVNGETFETAGAETIADLLQELGIEEGRVAVEVNLSIAKKAEYPTFRLRDDDRVEIINFVGGG